MLSTLNLKKATIEEWTTKNPILKIGDAGVEMQRELEIKKLEVKKWLEAKRAEYCKEKLNS